MLHMILNNSSTDIDECMLGTADCDPNADCMNQIGSYDCICRDGYAGSGLECFGKDIATAFNLDCSFRLCVCLVY